MQNAKVWVSDGAQGNQGIEDGKHFFNLSYRCCILHGMLSSAGDEFQTNQSPLLMQIYANSKMPECSVFGLQMGNLRHSIKKGNVKRKRNSPEQASRRKVGSWDTDFPFEGKQVQSSCLWLSRSQLLLGCRLHSEILYTISTK